MNLGYAQTMSHHSLSHATATAPSGPVPTAAIGAHLPDDWAGGLEDIHVWDMHTGQCSTTRRVWCVADNVSSPVYLPLVVRNNYCTDVLYSDNFLSVI